jgi:hypothetical protein
MNNKLIIIGVIGLAGAGAFLYFKSKNKLGKNDTPSSAGGLVAPSGTSVLPTSTTTTTTKPNETSVTIGDVVLNPPIQNVENAIKIAEAKDIARQINELRNTYEAERKNNPPNPALERLFINHPKSYPNRMKALNTSLALLGYTEVNGSIQKL